MDSAEEKQKAANINSWIIQDLFFNLRVKFRVYKWCHLTYVYFQFYIKPFIMQPHLHTIGEWKAEMNLADHILCNNISCKCISVSSQVV